MRQKVDRAGARRLLSILDGNAAAKLALGHKLAVPAEADLAGYDEHVSTAYEWHVVGNGTRGSREGYTDARELLFNRSGHSEPPLGGMILGRRQATAQAMSGRCCRNLRRPLSCPDPAAFWPAYSAGSRVRPQIMNKLLNARLFSFAILTMAVTVATTERPSAAPPADGTLLAPHRAIYDLTLYKSHGSRGIEAIRGRI